MTITATDAAESGVISTRNGVPVEAASAPPGGVPQQPDPQQTPHPAPGEGQPRPSPPPPDQQPPPNQPPQEPPRREAQSHGSKRK